MSGNTCGRAPEAHDSPGMRRQGLPTALLRAGFSLSQRPGPETEGHHILLLMASPHLPTPHIAPAQLPLPGKSLLSLRKLALSSPPRPVLFCLPRRNQLGFSIHRTTDTWGGSNSQLQLRHPLPLPGGIPPPLNTLIRKRVLSLRLCPFLVTSLHHPS